MIDSRTSLADDFLDLAPQPLRCRSCAKPVRVDDAYCPHCGSWDHTRSEPEPASPWDCIGAALMLLAAAMATMPTLRLFVVAIERQHRPDVLALAAWHCYVLGVPAAVVLYRWRRNILRQRPGNEKLIKTYFFTQFAVLIVLPFVYLVLIALNSLFQHRN